METCFLRCLRDYIDMWEQDSYLQDLPAHAFFHLFVYHVFYSIHHLILYILFTSLVTLLFHEVDDDDDGMVEKIF